MKQLLISLVVVLAVLTSFSQSTVPRTPGKSPEGVVKQFVKMDAEGARLTPEGWRQAAALFVQPSEPPQRNVLVIIARHYGVSEIAVKADTAEFGVGYEELGRMDSSLLFRPSNRGIQTRSICKYDLVLTSADHQVQRDGLTATAGNPPFQWKIKGTQPAEMHITVETARRYLTKMIDKTKDPAVKGAAEKTLATLKAYK